MPFFSPSEPSPEQLSRFSQIVVDCLALDLSESDYEAEVIRRTEAEFPGWSATFEPLAPKHLVC